MCAVPPPGGVLLPGGVSDTDGGGGDAHPPGAGQSRAGEVPAVQGRLQRAQERKGGTATLEFDFWLACSHAFTQIFWGGFLFLFLALLLVSREEVLLLHLGVHVPVLQEVRAHFLGKMIQLPERMKSKDLILPFFPGQCARSAPRR